VLRVVDKDGTPTHSPDGYIQPVNGYFGDLLLKSLPGCRCCWWQPEPTGFMTQGAALAVTTSGGAAGTCLPAFTARSGVFLSGIRPGLDKCMGWQVRAGMEYLSSQKMGARLPGG
jgi:hypothetical protein